VLSAYREALARRDLAHAARCGAGADLVNEA
jgi:hypothetical protein